MASITKRVGKSGTSYTVRVKKNGTRLTHTASTLREAREWAAKAEADIAAQKNGRIPNKTVGDLLKRYAEEVSVTKVGSAKEIVRINRFTGKEGDDLGEDFDGLRLADVKLKDLDRDVIDSWKDERLKKVMGSSVNRDLNLLSHAFNVAMKDWRWLYSNPVSEITRPKNSKPRDRRYTEEIIKTLSDAFKWEPGRKPKNKTERNGVMFRFAIETAMRRSEICSLTWDCIDLKKRVAHLSKTKNGDERDVPLSSEAVKLLRQMEGAQNDVEGSVFGMEEGVAETLWRDARDRVGLKDAVTFHDTRHEAITRLSKKLDVLALARMVGHRNIKQLMTYYNETAEELAAKLD